MSSQPKPQPQPQPQQPSELVQILQSVGTAGLAAVITVSFIHPIDVVKTRLQVSGEAGSSAQYNSIFHTVKSVYSEKGFASFYKGIQAAYLRESTYTALRLGLYAPIKDALAGKGQTPGAATKFLSGALAGALASSVGNPFDVLKTRMMADSVKEKRSLGHYVSEVYQYQGIKGFYKGITANVSRGVVLNATKLGTYDIIKTKIKTYGLQGIPLQFCSAFCAGFFMTVTVTPFDMIRTRLMNQPRDKILYHGLFDAASKITKSEGPLALYKGFFPVWGRFAPTTVLQLVIYEQLRKMVGMKQI